MSLDIQQVCCTAFRGCTRGLGVAQVAAASGDMRCALEACSLSVDEHATSKQKGGPPELISVQNMSQALAKVLGGAPLWLFLKVSIACTDKPTWLSATYMSHITT